MTVEDVRRVLERAGTAQMRKVYVRRGAGENCYGVSFSHLGKLKKAIGTDHALAQELWKTGNADARLLATMIADPEQASSDELDTWVRGIDWFMLADVFARYVAATRLAGWKMKAWMASPREFTGQVGWDLLAHAAMKNPRLPNAHFEERLAAIEQGIHAAPSRVRHAMNNAVIAIGIRNERLEKRALAAAERIGKVEVDQGETRCQTPDAAAYIKKAVEYRRRRR